MLLHINPEEFYGEAPDMGACEYDFVETEEIIEIPGHINYLSQNYPNPFNPVTTISFSIPNESIIEISVYNLKGQKVRTLVNNKFSNGHHSVIWDGFDELHKPLGSGVYLYKLNLNRKTEAIKKCLLLK